jgi:hypothetical protein
LETSVTPEINVHITVPDVEYEAELLFRALRLDALSTGDLKQTGQPPYRDEAPWRVQAHASSQFTEIWFINLS